MTTTAPLDEAHTAADEPKGGAVGTSRAFSWMLIITGAAGLLAAWVITLDKFKLLEDKNFKPGCSINPVVSCGNIMESDQASAFGVPNPMIGLVAYGIVIAVGVTLLTRAKFPRWYWLTFNAGCLFGVGFCTWLQYQSLYNIGSLCLWCSLAWVATIVMFWYVTAHNVRSGFLPAPAAVRGFADEFPWVVPVLHIGVIGILILTRWWDFWTS
ncbi:MULTISPECIES: vitamin K epoxide reductase family protein [unclassified Streptomyces]|uniref:vitamin K epoxide reductase family protein n=1 Tax=unclassified Streptomyces TaxID=2593676 RepID=UPI002DD9EA7A|nr:MULTISPECIES: vitamin K epoxide reductase family protein [unclassified Streptomyces]WSA96304.1 vitamin K epoxide reductase family protein [Streptomyces sp. NBC_01795]WSB80718.1 vitamin K epoxide reductase family protein [Streptomyces sp. NBC_01775]WSS11073.1 vitamin K epoxide reductase family protein [Streptomyces sp. NBC_01186]WSS39781.1 vitamin K epoxide reductase family protein [Streptomyces sp. NBC_01187]